jgi:hypothetical protein
MTRELREIGWWQRLNSLPTRYATMISYEEEATDIRNFEPVLIPGLLQTEAYARAVISVGRETDSEVIDQRVQARMKRQEVLARKPKTPRLSAVIAEAALLVEVGGVDVMREQLTHLIAMAAKANVQIQVLRFAAGAHLADQGGFLVLKGSDDPPLGYIDTLAGALFLESPQETSRLMSVFDHLQKLAMSPAESVKFMREKIHAMAKE